MHIIFNTQDTEDTYYDVTPTIEPQTYEIRENDVFLRLVETEYLYGPNVRYRKTGSETLSAIGGIVLHDIQYFRILQIEIHTILNNIEQTPIISVTNQSEYYTFNITDDYQNITYGPCIPKTSFTI